MLTRWRRHIGGSQLSDGVQMRDVMTCPLLGEGGFGQVYLARHRVLPNLWYAVKRLSVGKMKASPQGRQELRNQERERELLLFLARETRGTRFLNLFVRLVVYHVDDNKL